MISVTDSTYAPWLWGQMTLLVCKANSDRLSILYSNSFQQSGNAFNNKTAGFEVGARKKNTHEYTKGTKNLPIPIIILKLN